MYEELKAQMDRMEAKLDMLLALFAEDVDEVEAPTLVSFDDPPQKG